MQKVKFDIQGMTCSSCSAHVERAVNKLKRCEFSKCEFTFK